jgi:hypothetical protein
MSASIFPTLLHFDCDAKEDEECRPITGEIRGKVVYIYSHDYCNWMPRKAYI